MPEKKRNLGKLSILGRRVPSPPSPEKAKLEIFVNKYPRDYWVTFHCPEFTSLCPRTNQPDFGTITIRYVPDKKCLEAKSLKLYLFSYRNIGIFNEDVVNKILEDIVEASKPRRAEVSGEFNPRGGININVEATYKKGSKRGRG